MCGSSKLFLVQSAFVGATEDEVVTLATVLSPWSGLVLHATVDAVVLYDANSGRQLKRLDQLMAGGGADVTACAADPCIRKVRCAVFCLLSLSLSALARAPVEWATRRDGPSVNDRRKMVWNDMESTEIK